MSNTDSTRTVQVSVHLPRCDGTKFIFSIRERKRERKRLPSQKCLSLLHDRVSTLLSFHIWAYGCCYSLSLSSTKFLFIKFALSFFLLGWQKSKTKAISWNSIYMIWMRKCSIQCSAFCSCTQVLQCICVNFHAIILQCDSNCNILHIIVS